MRALASYRPASLAPLLRPAWDLFTMRSPTNMVKNLLMKSDPTIERAVAIDSEKQRDVMNATELAMTCHIKALTMERTMVSARVMDPAEQPR